MSLVPLLAARSLDTYPAACRVDISDYFKDCDAIDIVVRQPHRFEEKKEGHICITPTRPDGYEHFSHPDPPVRAPTRGPSRPPTRPPPRTSTRGPTPTSRPHGGGPHGGGSHGPNVPDGPRPGKVHEYCKKPAVDINVLELVKIGLVDTDDLALYANILGIEIDLSELMQLLGNLFGGGSGTTTPGSPAPAPPAGNSPGSAGPPAPGSFACSYTPHCGKSLKKCPGVKTATSADYIQCLHRCEASAIISSIESGDLHLCLGASVDNVLGVDNCIFITGATAVDIDLDLLIDDDNCDSFFH